MQNLKKLWTAISGEEFVDEAQKGDATTEKLRRLLKSCAICGKGFSHHFYALFATTVFSAEEKSRVVSFFKTLEEHRWRDSLEFQEWDALRNNAEAYAIRCSTGRMALLTVHSPYEVYEHDSAIAYEVLNMESGQELASLIEQNKWKPLQP